MIVRQVTTCSCSICKDMCKNPCIPTPEDAEALINAGYKEKLCDGYIPVPRLDIVLPVILPLKTDKGCIFLTSDGLCQLHDKGLKPTEGKLAIHNLADEGLRKGIAFRWVSVKGIEVMKTFPDTTNIVTYLEILLKHRF